MKNKTAEYLILCVAVLGLATLSWLSQRHFLGLDVNLNTFKKMAHIENKNNDAENNETEETPKRLIEEAKPTKKPKKLGLTRSTGAAANVINSDQDRPETPPR